MCDDGNPAVSESRPFQEWKQCQQSAMAFDKMILEIRKYGFSFVTLLITAEGFLLGKIPPNNLVVLGVYAALLILILALFRIDRMHEVFLRGAVLRAMRLEAALDDMGLTRSIAYWSEKSSTATWGNLIYVLFALAACALSVAAIHMSSGSAVQVPVVDLLTDHFATIAAFALLLLFVVFLFHYHDCTKPSLSRGLNLDPDDPFKQHLDISAHVWTAHEARHGS